MKLNHMICPTCGHDFYTDAAYATCDACQRLFYAGQSRTCKERRPGVARDRVMWTWPAANTVDGAVTFTVEGGFQVRD